MAGAPLNPRLAPYYVAAGKKWGIPPAVIAGLADVETDQGANEGPSSTGARYVTQFEPAEAARYGVHDDPSAIDGAAHYLHDLGYSRNPVRALAEYNAGPNYGPGLGYARQVLSQASRLAPALGTVAPASSSSSSSSSSQVTGGGGGSSDYSSVGGWLLKAVLTVALIAGGLFLAIYGANGALGGRPAHALKRARGSAELLAAT